MKLEEIKPGMVFKENDKRLTRFVKVVCIGFSGRIFLVASQISAVGPWRKKTTSCQKPERFHVEPKASGYSLVFPEHAP